MRFRTYGRYEGTLADALNLQALLDRLSGFLLDSGFPADPWSRAQDGDGQPDGDSLQALRDAILQALLESGELTPEMVAALRGDGDPDPAILDEIARLLDDIVRRLVDEGYLRVDEAPRMPQEGRALTGPGSMGRGAARSLTFDLTDKGLDYLGHRALREILGPLGRAAPGAHDTHDWATGVEVEAGTKAYEFGDTLNLDVAATLRRTIAREGLTFPLRMRHSDLQVHQAVYRASAATVLMLDCSHSMILYGEDRFTPAKKVALALAHLLRTQFPGDSIDCVLFHDTAERIPLAELARARVGPYHTNTAEGLRVARRLLRGRSQEMRQIVMITDGKPSAVRLPDGRVYRNSMGLDRFVLRETFAEVAACRREGIAVNTFMLARDPALVRFVRTVSEMTRGRAFLTSTMSLGRYILMDFLRRRTRGRG
ncbi:MAG: VWA domain-containing protein [Gemmatimonadota bacterium]|nr:VWA domain-containing protein [Gemmatimonadota bacterium]